MRGGQTRPAAGPGDPRGVPVAALMSRRVVGIRSDCDLTVAAETFARTGLRHLVVVRADSLDLTQHRPQLGRRIVEGRQDGLRNLAPRRWTIEAPSWWRGLPA